MIKTNGGMNKQHLGTSAAEQISDGGMKNDFSLTGGGVKEIS